MVGEHLWVRLHVSSLLVVLGEISPWVCAKNGTVRQSHGLNHFETPFSYDPHENVGHVDCQAARGTHCDFTQTIVCCPESWRYTPVTTVARLGFCLRFEGLLMLVDLLIFNPASLHLEFLGRSRDTVETAVCGLNSHGLGGCFHDKFVNCVYPWENQGNMIFWGTLQTQTSTIAENHHWIVNFQSSRLDGLYCSDNLT